MSVKVDASCKVVLRTILISSIIFISSHISVVSATVESGEVLAGEALQQGGEFAKLIPPFSESTPENTVGNNNFQTPNLYAFDEDQNIELTAELPVDLLIETNAPGALPIGTTVASHYVFFDPSSSTTINGEIRFDSEIVAVITSSSNLQSSDFLVNTNVNYLSPSLRGLEDGQDSIALIDTNTLRVNFGASSPGDYIRVLTRFSPGAAECAVEVVFAVDTSGSMNDDIVALCDNISAVEEQLRAQGINATTHLLGITQTRNCLTSTVVREVGSVSPGNNGACGDSLNQLESWGQATASLARNFPWTPGATRVVIPISDEGPCDGGGGPDAGSINQADRDAVTNAIDQAQRAGVFVSPITASGSALDMIELAGQLATATGGSTVQSSDPDLDIAGLVGNLVERACSSDICTVIESLGDEERPVTFRPLSTDFNGIIGIDFFEPTDSLLVSVNYPDGQPRNFELVASDGTREGFSSIAGLTDEVKIAVARSSQSGGFTDGDDIPAGTAYAGTGVEGELLRINPDRTTLRIDTGAIGLFRGALYVDRTGVFDGDLIAVSTGGTVLRVTASNAVNVIAQVNQRFEGVTVIPDDPVYGDFAGRILIGAETVSWLYAVNKSGVVDIYQDIGVAIEDIDVIPENENFFGSNFGTGQLLGAESIQWRGYRGKILLTQEFPTANTSGLYILEWNAGPKVTPLELTDESTPPGQWEHVTFAPAGILELPIPPICSLAGKPDLTTSIPRLNNASCPGTLTVNAEVGNVGLGLAPKGSIVKVTSNGRSLGSLPLARDLAPGEFETISISNDDFIALQQTLEVTSDADSRLAEIDESNNSSSIVAGQCTQACIEDLAVRVKRGKVQITWSPFTDANYRVERSTDPSGPWQSISETTSTFSTYVDDSAPQGSNVYYRVVRSPGEFGDEFCTSDSIAAFVAGSRSRTRLATVPDLAGLTPTEAASVLSAANLTLGTVENQDNLSQADGLIFAQQPPKGSSVPANSSVALKAAINPLPINFSPTIDSIEQFPVNEGQRFLLRAGFSDPDSNNWTASVDFGDGANQQQVFVPADKQIVASNTFPDNGSFTARLRVSDDQAATAEQEFEIVIRNLVPKIFAGGAENVTRDQPFERTAFFTDPGADTWTGTVSWGDGTAAEPLDLAANKTFALNHTFTAEGFFTVIVRISDDDGDEGTTTFAIRVARPSVEVPDVTGLTLENARNTLEAAGLVLGSQSQLESRIIASGLVIEQNPVAGAQVAEGLSVSLDLSVGNINENPQITSPPPRVAIEGLLFSYPITVLDPDNDTLSFALINAPEGMTIDIAGVISWLPAAEQVGRVIVSVRVTDEFGAVDQLAFAIRVAANVPVTLADFTGSSRGEVEQNLEQAGLIVGQVTNVVDTSVPPGTVISTTVAPGTVLQAGSEVGLTIAVSAQRNTPRAAIAAPTPSLVLDTPTTVVGTVEPATEGTAAGSVLNWQLVLTRADDPTPKVIGKGTGAVFGERLGSVDPTMLANDSYKLSLAYQQGGFAGSTSVPFDVEGELKLGNFRVNFTDVEVNFNDLPIVVSRDYDTIDLANTDFGFGWRLSIPGTVRDAAPEGTPFVRGTRVYVTLPGGERYGFRFEPQPLSFLFPWISSVIFTPEPGVDGKLEAVGAGSVFSFGGLYSNLISPYNPRLYRFTAADGTQFVIDEFDGLRTATDINGNQLFYSQNGIVDANGNGVQFVRDGQNRITQVVAPDGNIVSYSYDNNGDLVGVTDQNAIRTTIEYDAGLAHYVSKITRDNNVLIQPIFAEVDGRLVAVCSGDDDPVTLEGCTQMSFDPENRSQRLIEPGNRITDVVYDTQGNIEKETLFLEDGTSLVDSFVYDARGNQTSVQDSGGYKVDLAYDDSNNVSRIEMLGQVGEFTHNSCNQISTYHLNEQLIHTYKYDSTGCNLTEVIDASGKIIEYQYDSQGRNTAIIDSLGNNTQFSYDSNGKLNLATDALGVNSNFTYDTSGRLKNRTDRNGRKIEYAYDAVGNMTKEIWVDSSPLVEFNYSYDALDRVVEIDGPNTTLAIQYNQDGERSQVITSRKTIVPGAETVSFEYDEVGNVTRLNDGDGGEIRIRSDNANRPVKVTQTGVRERSATFEFDDSHVLRRVNFFSDLAATSAVGYSEFDYDCAGCAERPKSIRHFNAAGTPVATYDIELNELHDITAINTNAGRVEYEFDARRQITDVSRSFASDIPDEAYGYDSAGNRLASHFAGTHQLVADANGANRLASNELSEYLYDGEGNLVAKTDKASGVRIDYVYDYRGRLVSATRLAAGVLQVLAEYYYDPLDRRIAKVTPDFTRLYVNAGRNLLLEKDGAGNLIKRHFFEPRFPDVTLAYELPAEDYWLLTDQVGTVLDALDGAGDLAQTIEMSAYGRPAVGADPLPFPAIFAATEADAETGLYYARSRYYDPELGRFISEDPLGFVGGDENLYRYSKNNPVRFLDPFGRASLSYAQINQRIAVFQRAAIRCLGDAVFTNAAEVGVYLIIEAVALKYSRSGPDNVYAGRTRNKKGFKARFYQHGRSGRRMVSTITFRVNQNIINNPKAFAELEQLLIDSFGGKAQLTNKVNAVAKTRKNVFCVK